MKNARPRGVSRHHRKIGALLNTPDLTAAAEAVAVAREVCRKAAAHLAELSSEDGRISVAKLDEHQVLAYDLAHVTAGIEGAAVMCDYGNHGGLEARLACLFTAEAISDLVARLVGREGEWGVSAMDLAPAGEFVNAHRAPEFLEDVAEEVARHGGGSPWLDEEFELVRDTFHRFAADKVRPVAEHVHRKNEDIPEDVISGLAEIGGFGLSVPEEFGGFAAGGESDYLGMVIATEELSWGSLNVGGSLITRPEILTRALVRGGTEDQKKDWLPRIAAGEAMVGVMVTEPDYGSDVANLKVTATKTEGGYRINGVKTWATFAGRANTLMLLARTDPDKSQGPQGPVALHRREARGSRPPLRVQSGRRREVGGPGDRHARLPRHAFLRGGLRRLVRPRSQPDRPRGRSGQRLLLPDGGVRERPAADRGPGGRPHAGGLRSGARLRQGTAASSTSQSSSTS